MSFDPMKATAPPRKGEAPKLKIVWDRVKGRKATDVIEVLKATVPQHNRAMRRRYIAACRQATRMGLLVPAEEESNGQGA